MTWLSQSHASAWTTAHAAAVETIIRTVSRTTIEPLCGHLTRDQVTEKAPGEIVTVADVQAENELADMLTGLLPGSMVMGEEALHRDPGLMELVCSEDPVWIIDPIDGTENFVAGSPRFSTLVALAWKSVLLGGWTFSPLLNLFGVGSRGAGSTLNGLPLHVRPTSTLQNINVSLPRWWNSETRLWVDRATAQDITLTHFDTAGLLYIDLAANVRTAALLQWDNLWDHAAGILLFQEAGGMIQCVNGATYELAGGNQLPLIAASDPRAVDAIRRQLLQD